MRVAIRIHSSFCWVALAVAAALGFVSIALSPAAAQTCAGDCDDSGRVTIDEMVAATRVGLGTVDVDLCPNADANHDGSVSVDDLISDVDNLLQGCPAPTSEVAPAAALAVARLAEHIHALSRAVAVAFDGSDQTELCIYGGVLENMCEDSGSGSVRVDIDARACKVESLEGDVTYDGPVVLTGSGRCPDVVLPLNLNLALDWTGVTEREDGTPHSELSWQGAVHLQAFMLGPSPCSVKGARTVLNGRIELDTLDGATIVAEPSDLRLVVEFRDLLPDFACEPQEVVATLDGLVRIEDTFGSSTQTTNVTLKNFKSTLSRTSRQLAIEGDVEGGCFGGRARLETVETLGAPLGAGCFDAGLLEVGLPAGTAALRFGAGGTLDVDGDGDGVFEGSYSSCAERVAGRCGRSVVTAP